MIQREEFAKAGHVFSQQKSQDVRKEAVKCLSNDPLITKRAQAFISRPKQCRLCHQTITLGNVIQERLLQTSKDCKAFMQHGFLCNTECDGGPSCQWKSAHPGYQPPINVPKKRHLLTPIVDGQDIGTDLDRLIEGMTKHTEKVLLFCLIPSLLTKLPCAELAGGAAYRSDVSAA